MISGAYFLSVPVPGGRLDKVVIAASAQRQDAEDGVRSRLEDGADEGADCGSRGDDIVDDEYVFALQQMGLGHAEDVVHVLQSFELREMGLRGVVHRTEDTVGKNVESHRLPYSPGYLFALIEATPAETLGMERDGDDDVDALEELPWEVAAGQRPSQAVTGVDVLAILDAGQQFADGRLSVIVKQHTGFGDGGMSPEQAGRLAGGIVHHTVCRNHGVAMGADGVLRYQELALADVAEPWSKELHDAVHEERVAHDVVSRCRGR